MNRKFAYVLLLLCLSTLNAWAGKAHTAQVVPFAPVLALSDFRHAEASYDGERVVVHVTLGEVAAVRVGKYSADHVGERLALIVDDHVLATPVLRVPITGTALDIDALSRVDADAFVKIVNAQ